MPRLLPYRRFTILSPDDEETVRRRLTLLSRSHGGVFVGRLSPKGLKVQRYIGFRREPGLPVAVGTLVAKGGSTELHVVLRLQIVTIVFYGVWLVVGTLFTVGLVAQALRGGSWLQVPWIVGLVLLPTAWVLWVFHRESAWMEKTLRDALEDDGDARRRLHADPG